MTIVDSNASAQKEFAYYECEREEMLSFIPSGAKKIIDIGCGAGNFGKLIKERIGAEVWGIEMKEEPANKARKLLDNVIVGAFPEVEGIPEKSFDVVIFNDCLEHMADPWTALDRTKELLRDDGVVVASIPNVRYIPLIYRLVVEGDWRYTPSGILDTTHLRFFTKRSMTRMFHQTGYDVLRAEGINPLRRWQISLLRIFFRRFVAEAECLEFAFFGGWGGGGVLCFVCFGGPPGGPPTKVLRRNMLSKGHGL